MHVVKRQVDVLHPFVRAFAYKPHIRLLTFLSTIRPGFEILGVKEVYSVRVLAYYFEGRRRKYC